MQREARPFADSSDEAAAARRALPFDAWIHAYFPHYASCESSPLHLLADEIVEEKGIPVAEFWFRGAGKTTRALLRRIRRIVERRAHFILVGGQTEENAAEKLDLIKLELVNNPRLRQDYGDRDRPARRERHRHGLDRRRDARARARHGAILPRPAPRPAPAGRFPRRRPGGRLSSRGTRSAKSISGNGSSATSSRRSARYVFTAETQRTRRRRSCSRRKTPRPRVSAVQTAAPGARFC